MASSTFVSLDLLTLSLDHHSVNCKDVAARRSCVLVVSEDSCRAGSIAEKNLGLKRSGRE